MNEELTAFKEAEALVNARSEFDSWWQLWSEYVMPRKSFITEGRSGPEIRTSQRVYDTTAIHANQVLANGHMSHMTPIGDPWFSFVPQDDEASDKARSYFAKCTEVALRILAESNFYTEIHETYLNRSGLGTACLSCMPDDKSVVRFRSIPVGRFAVADDDDGNVDTVLREMEVTGKQLEEMFGADKLPEQVVAELSKPEAFTKKHKVWHFVKPNRKYNPDVFGSFPFLSYYYHYETKVCLEKAGFTDFPFMVTRYLKWGNYAYGWCPTWLAFPAIVQLNEMAANADTLAEIQAFPRLLIPDSLVGDVDLRAGGATVIDGSSPVVPQEWGTQGRYDVFKDRIADRKQEINDLYHVSLFQMFASLDKEMTAREVAARERERIEQFSPSFTRFVNDFNPMLQRIFAIIYNAGMFPEPPQEVLQQDENGVFMPPPKVFLNSRISLALQQVQNSAFDRTLERSLMIAQVSPEAMDAFNFDTAMRDSARTEGISERWLKSMEEIEQMRQARMEAQQRAEQLATLTQGSEAVKNVAQAGLKEG